MVHQTNQVVDHSKKAKENTDTTPKFVAQFSVYWREVTNISILRHLDTMKFKMLTKWIEIE